MPHESAEPWTVNRLLRWTADFLKRKGAESPRLDAELLLAHVVGWDRVGLYVHFEEEVGEKERTAFRELVRRRSEGTPVAYLLGRKEFFSMDFRVDPSVLIPRPDSETLVVEAIDRLKAMPGTPRVVDVGTGSGCLALAIAKNVPSARVFAVDLSQEALAVAEGNARELALGDRVTFRRSDLFEAVAEDGPFEVIVSNPPYIPSAEIATLDRCVRDHEPRSALDGGEDGLRVVDRLIEQAGPLLIPGGFLLLEIGATQENAVRELILKRSILRSLQTLRDAGNQPRVVRAEKPRD